MTVPFEGHVQDTGEKLELELRESGGIANLARVIRLDDRQLTFVDNGKIKRERTLNPAEHDRLVDLIRRLEEVDPRPTYGRQLLSDPIRSVLSVKLDSRDATVEVLTDPADQPPAEYSAIVRQLRALAQGLRPCEESIAIM